MDKISEIVASSISRDLAEVNRISTNTQNVTTVGFKALLDVQADSSEKPSAIQAAKMLNMSQGELRQTERTLDFAIHGDGWFVLKRGNVSYLTRNGQFQLDKNGYVTDSKGYRLQGSGGDIRLEDTRVSVSRMGNISAQDREVDNILLVTTGNIKPDQYQGGNILLKRSPQLTVNSDSKILQGYLEQSNVEPSAEVVAMMAASRHVQTMQKSLAAYDQVLKKAISELGK